MLPSTIGKSSSLEVPFLCYTSYVTLYKSCHTTQVSKCVSGATFNGEVVANDESIVTQTKVVQ